MEEYNLEASEEWAGRRIDKVLSEYFDNYSRSFIKKLFEDGQILVNGKSVKPSYNIKNGDTCDISVPDPVNIEIEPEDIPLDIIYEDSDVILVNKPKGMVVHPAPGNYDRTLVNALLWHCGDSLSGINGVIRPGIVHRIDKDTSGLLIVAKNDAAHIGLAKQISAHSFYRAYHAVCVGRPRSDKGDISAPIGRNPNDRKKMAVVADGRYALTHYSVLDAYRGYSYLELVLETGRTHQIRVHMSSIGHPLFCDSVYGAGHTPLEKQLADKIGGQCLHAKKIGFVHPITGKDMFFDSSLPDYFEYLLDRLEKDQI